MEYIKTDDAIFYTDEAGEVRQSDRQSVSPSQKRMTFPEAVAKAETQIDFAYMPARIRPQAKEIALIIAEIYIMDPERSVKIAGELIDIYTVQQIFEMLTGEHAMAVINSFNAVRYTVTNKRGYLRSSLYSVVFELNSGIENQVQTDLYGK